MHNILPAPPLSQKEQKALSKAQKKIETTDYFWDGPAWHMLGDGVCLVSYAWNLACREMPTDGPLSVALLLRHKRETLWQLRSSTVLEAGQWDFSVSGSLDVPRPLEVIRREAQEEIGLHLLEPRCLGLHRSQRENMIVFEQEWQREELQPGPEIDHLCWQEDIPEPSLPGRKEILISTF